MMRIVVLLLALTTTAAADWKAAEKLVRDRMAAQKLTVVDLQSRPSRPFGTAFWLQVKDAAGTTTPRFVVVRGTTVHDTPSDATLSAILKADDFLKTRALGARDFLYLLRELGRLPAGLGTRLVTVDPDGRVGPALAFDKDRATFVLRSHREVPPARGAPANPKVHYTRATLTIASDYTLSWQVVDEDLPVR